MLYRINLMMVMLFAILKFANAAQRNQSIYYNVKDYGAAGNGVNLDSKAINKAIDAAANAGGGTVYFPAGNYLSGSIHLKSNISLFIDQRATIIAPTVKSENDYDEDEVSVKNTYQNYCHS